MAQPTPVFRSNAAKQSARGCSKPCSIALQSKPPARGARCERNSHGKCCLFPDCYGQFVVVHDGKPIDFFESYGDAYQAGLDRFGVDEIYLVSKVQEQKPEPASVSWEFGLLA